MFTSRRIVQLAVAAAILGLAVTVAYLLTDEPPGAAPTTRVVQPGAPGQSGRTLSPDDLSSVAPPAHSAADTAFMRRMIAHHAQALRMTALVKDRGGSRDVAQLARRIETSQRDEIAQMQGWMRERGERHGGHSGHDGSMPGMLSEQEFGRLERARGAGFDRLFLQFMIRHHEGALTMVRELYAAGGGVEPASDRFAREVNADQTIEIGRMRGMLSGAAG